MIFRMNRNSISLLYHSKINYRRCAMQHLKHILPAGRFIVQDICIQHFIQPDTLILYLNVPVKRATVGGGCNTARRTYFAVEKIFQVFFLFA